MYIPILLEKLLKMTDRDRVSLNLWHMKSQSSGQVYPHSSTNLRKAYCSCQVINNTVCVTSVKVRVLITDGTIEQCACEF